MKYYISFLFTVLISLSNTQAIANVFHVDSIMSGTYSNSGNLLTHDFDSFSLISGDSNIFSQFSQTTILDSSLLLANVTTYCNISNCSFEETVIGGDTFNGTFNFTNINVGSNLTTYEGNFTILDGTGLFAGATGTGVFSGSDSHLDNTSVQRNIFTITTAVPEPKTYAMFVLGLLVVGCFRPSKRDLI